MLTSRTFLKRTRAGAVVKVVREHYLREDIPCGAAACRLCPPRPAGAGRGLEAQPSGAASSLCPGPHYLLPDTNLLLHQVSGPPPVLREGAGGRAPAAASAEPPRRAGGREGRARRLPPRSGPGRAPRAARSPAPASAEPARG